MKRRRITDEDLPFTAQLPRASECAILKIPGKAVVCGEQSPKERKWWQLAGLGLEASRDKFSVPSSQRSHSPREMLS